MEQGYKEPLYTIGIAARLLKVCQATLRIWERKGLIKPARLGKNRFYSKCDIDQLQYIKVLIQKEKVNIEGVKRILGSAKCWEVRKCKPKEKELCPVYLKYGHA